MALTMHNDDNHPDIHATPFEQEELTKWIRRSKNGDREAEQSVYKFVYAKLKVIAQRERRTWPKDATLDTTSLVHEFFLKFTKSARGHVDDRKHFFNLATRMMRQILINNSKKKQALKRGGDAVAVELRDEMIIDAKSPERLLLIDQFLTDLEREDELAANVFIGKWFASMTNEEIAEALEIGLSTVKRRLVKANEFVAKRMVDTTEG